MAQNTVQNFNMTFNLLTERARTQHQNAGQDLALFTVRFPWLTQSWLDDYLADIDEADNYPSDDDLVTGLTVLTYDLGETHKASRLALNVVDAYATIMWPKEKVLQRQFGQDRWQKAYGNSTLLNDVLRFAFNRCSIATIKADLFSKGMAQGDIDVLNSLANEITNKNMLQEEAKTDRKISTRTRLLLHNGVHEKMALVAVCSTAVWPDNAEKQEQYQVYPTGHGSPTTNLNLTIIRNGAALPDTQVTLTNTALATQTTDANGIASFSSVDLPEFVDVLVDNLGTVWNRPALPVNMGVINNVVINLNEL
ncbi:MAG: hypothetical protein ACKVOR_10570 [Flavobacteriales bacterium]